MLPITAVIIARNEAAHLPQCLPTLQEWIAGIKVVIHDCTDETRAVAESFGAHVVEHAWEGFAQQRNFGQMGVITPWIFRIDADEWVTPELRADIEHFFAERQDEHYAAVRCYRMNRYLNRWCDLRDRQLILYRTQGSHWQGVVHERLCFTGNVKQLSSYLYHATEVDVAHTLRKNMHYAQLKAVELAQRTSLCWLLLKCCFDPPCAFLKSYLQRRAYRNGLAGFYVAVVMAITCLLKYLFALDIKSKEAATARKDDGA